MTQRYAVIRVHEDVLEGARDVTAQMERAGYWWLTQGLKDLVDPLPEEDIYGQTPGITYEEVEEVASQA